jgi:hypothetical protein
MGFVDANGVSVLWEKIKETFAEKSHTHKYAGSSSSGGAATSADKLNANAGDANTPVYFSNGVPVVCSALKWQDIYPVGAIYQSFDPTSPAALFGGSWTQITGRFLYCTTNTAAGGSNSHTLTTAQLPKNKAYSSANVNGNAGFSDALYTGAFTQGSEYVYLNLTYMGGGSSHNNMPSYQGVYAWRRTA